LANEAVPAPARTAGDTASRHGDHGHELAEVPVDEISRQVGYEEPAFFRRLFKTSDRAPTAARFCRGELPSVLVSSHG
jgi:hypothetical protein